MGAVSFVIRFSAVPLDSIFATSESTSLSHHLMAPRLFTGITGFLLLLFKVYLLFLLHWVFSAARALSWTAVATLHGGVRTSHRGGFSRCSSRALGCLDFISCSSWAQQLWCRGFTAPRQACGIFLDQGLNRGLLHCRRILYQLSYDGSPLNDHAAAAAAKSLQSCPTLCDPIDGSPPGSPIPGILLARTLEWVAISFSNA